LSILCAKDEKKTKFANLLDDINPFEEKRPDFTRGCKLEAFMVLLLQEKVQKVHEVRS
jgi:hypothetical protein